MNRGFISGLVWGSVAATLSVVLAAQLVNERSLPVRPGDGTVAANRPGAPDARVSGAAATDEASRDAASDDAVTAGSAPGDAAVIRSAENTSPGGTPEPGDEPSIFVPETAPAPETETANAVSAEGGEIDAGDEGGLFVDTHSGEDKPVALADAPEVAAAPRDGGAGEDASANAGSALFEEDRPETGRTPSPAREPAQRDTGSATGDDALPAVEVADAAPGAVPLPTEEAPPGAPRAEMRGDRAAATPGRAAIPDEPGALPRVEPLERLAIVDGIAADAPGAPAPVDGESSIFAENTAPGVTSRSSPAEMASAGAAAPDLPARETAPTAGTPPEEPATDDAAPGAERPDPDADALFVPAAPEQDSRPAAEPAAPEGGMRGAEPGKPPSAGPRPGGALAQKTIDAPAVLAPEAPSPSAPGIRRLALDEGGLRGVGFGREPAPRVIDATGPQGANPVRPRKRTQDAAPANGAQTRPAPDPDSALMRYAAAPAGRIEGPILSIVLLDTGGPLIDTELPVTIAIDAGQRDAQSRAAAYRAAGREVVMIPSVPRGALASDVDAALQDSLTLVPEAVAVMDDPAGDLQDDRTAMQQILARLDETGHGLVTFPRGLNGAQQEARRAGIPGALVFRQIDGEGQDRAAVKRFLDHAAFRARQLSTVVLFGRNRPETLEALDQWMESERASGVTLAPISTALTAGR
ncbi:polysaccharide deacteylase family 2 protein [Profundibacterium mesophilum]|uniref:polysaccharide deacteylase family 2 protein n=1 Tax=Profundibacterium mesophilum TaxID=1258573 RepID=UPI00135BC554|nr:polysaccharide deacteylase family 2 protein [Profundibacterium mesophilum]